MAEYRHSFRSLGPDYLRSLAGLALTAGPLAFLPVLTIVGWALALAAIAFALSALNALARHLSVVLLDDTGLRVKGPLPRRIGWADMRGFRLRYFSTRRDREKGWMQLILKGKGRTIRIESTLNGFEDIVSRAAVAAAAAGLDLETATLGNLEALGIEMNSERQPTDPHAGFVER